jgi:hypothetical protein
LDAHHQIVVEEFTRIGSIRSDPADNRREVNDDVGPRILENALNRLALHEIIVSTAWDKGGDATTCHQLRLNAPPEKPRATSQQDATT